MAHIVIINATDITKFGEIGMKFPERLQEPNFFSAAECVVSVSFMP